MILAAFSYPNSVTAQISSHAAGTIVNGQGLSVPHEGGRLLWVEFLVVLCKTIKTVSLCALCANCVQSGGAVTRP